LNRHCHRIIFNVRREQRMAVAETTQSNGKSASGENQAPVTKSHRATSVHKYRRTMLAVSFATTALPMALAQVIADPTAPASQRPTVLSDSAGRLLVNIQTPSAAGLSRNSYKQFDVPTKGIVLNNSSANPWLSNGVLAKTILNEVNATSPSYILGAITVNGVSAQVIVANPNGITVNGGGFVNASRATLTTGTAQVTNGVLTGFNVRGGGIAIGSNGLDNSATPYTDVISRTVSVAGQVRAQNLGMTTGLQTVAYDTGLISDQDTQPYAVGALAIDTAAIGGMYANNIRIVATEAGLGVRNLGTWQATGGQIVVTSEGLLQNLSAISAGAVSLATVTGHIENAGSVQGTQAVVFSSGGDTRLFGSGLQQTAGSAIVISAKGAVNLYNHATYGAAKVASNAAGGQVGIGASQNINFNPGTAVTAFGDVLISSDAQWVVNSASVVSSAGKVTALAGTGMGLFNSTVTGQQVHLETGAAFKDTNASLMVTGGNVRGQTQTTLLSTDSILISNSGSTAISGGGNVHLQAAKALDITAGTAITAGQHMSVMSGTALTLQASSGTSANNGQKVLLSAGGNMLLSGNTVTATGANLTAGQDLDIEANDGNANLNALFNAGGTSVDKVNLSAGKDLNVSVFKGSLYATGLQASGQNIAIMSNGTTSVANTMVRNASGTQAVASNLNAREDLVVGSISTSAGPSSQVQLVATNLMTGGQAKVLSNGVALITAVTDNVNGVITPARSSITAGSVVIQSGEVQTDAADIRTNGDKSSVTKSGDIVISAATGTALFNTFSNYRSQLNSTGNIALYANTNLTHWYTQVNAGGGLSSTSATGQINGVGANLSAKDILSFASKDAQKHTSGFYSGGAASIYNESGNLVLQSTRLQAIGTNTTGMSTVSGQASIESGGTLNIDAASVLVAATDLSIIQGQGDITIQPKTATRGSLAWSQIGVNRNLTLATRNGNVKFTGSAGTNGVGSSSNVGLYVNGDFNLIGNSVTLEGTRIQTGGALNITATTSDLTTRALQANQTVAGYKNTYWDYVQLIGGTGVNVRAAGNIAMDSVYVQSNGSVNIQSVGNTTIAGNYAHFTVNNQASGGWYQDQRYLWRSVINGNTGVTIGATGGALTLSATDVEATNGKATLQALGAVNLRAAQEYRLLEKSESGSDDNCFLFFCQTTNWTNYFHNEYLLNKPINVKAQDIDIKAGNSISTFGTQFNASRNLAFTAGDSINYYAVTDQKLETVKRNESSGWGIGGLFSINVGSGSNTNSLSQLNGQPTALQSQGNILSNSGGNQLLQGTKVRYGGSAVFNAGVGEKARTDARIILEGVKTTTTQTRTREANYVVWQKQVNQGRTAETLAMPSFTGSNKPVFSAPGGLNVQISDGNFKSQIQTLSSQPGLGYLNDLTARKDVNWQPVKLAYETWDYQQSGLTPSGAALLSVAVAWATAGQGATLMSTTGTTASAVANAAMSSLAAQVSISFVNNKGDISKTLKELGASQTVKATIAAALTAGVLDKLGNANEMGDIKSSIHNGTAGFSEKLTYSLINATGRALTNTAINGGNLEDALKQALIGGMVDTLHGQAASQIKLIESEYLAHKLAHALAGCIAGSAVGGACKDGAIGGAVGEIVAEMFPKPGEAATTNEINAFNARVLSYSKLVAGAVSAYAGGNAQTAITAAEVAVKNNYCGYTGCVNRRFNWNDAVDQWRNGKGATVTDVNVSELNLKDATFKKNNDGTYQIHTSLKFDTGAIYGTVTGFLNPDGTLSIKPDTYNFDMKYLFKDDSIVSARDALLRDVLTGIGLVINGYGKEYEIKFTGSIPLPKGFPK